MQFAEHVWGRGLREAAEYPTCNTDTSKWPADVDAACKAQVQAGLRYPTVVTSEKSFQLCASSACMRIEAIMKADNPVECQVTARLLLYKDMLTPIDNVCRLLNAPIAADPSTSPSTPSPAATAAPSSTTKTPQPSATTTKTKAPSPSIPDSNGAAGSNMEGESTAPPSDTSTTTSSSSSSPPAPSSSLVATLIPSAGSGSSSASASSASIRSSQNPSVFNTPNSTESPNGTLRDSTTDASSPTGLIAGIVVGAVVLVAIIFVFFKRKSSKNGTKHDASVTNTTTETSMFTQEHTSDFYNQLVALEKWKIDSSDLVDGRLLGCGAHGAVYLVTLDGGRRLASKRLIRDQLTSQRLNSVVAEIELIATLVHPSIVEFVGVAWTTPSDLQILFEYMPNGDLRTHLDQTKPSQHQPKPWTTEKLKHTIQIAQALVYVHSFNPPVVHRDIKARNVLLDDEMNAKLSDFGVSRSLSEQATMTTGIGTSRWLAPEVIMGGGKYTEQCDIYSFGVLLVEMDSHAIPFADEKLPEIELLHRVATGTLRPTLSAQCDPLLRELILQCLSVDPSARPNALELSYRLRKMQ